MGRNRNRVVLDTNILVSALIFEGKPRTLLELALKKNIIVCISKPLLAELQEILLIKFEFSEQRVKQIERKLTKAFRLVYPKKQIKVVRDSDDNKVLEAAIEGKCQYIITGDKDLLDLMTYKRIKILKANEFINLIGEN